MISYSAGNVIKEGRQVAHVRPREYRVEHLTLLLVNGTVRRQQTWTEEHVNHAVQTLISSVYETLLDARRTQSISLPGSNCPGP